jgi:hypothetical protein
MGNVITGGTTASVGTSTTTADLIARLRDLVAEEGADLFTDATEVLPSINEGVAMLFSDLYVLPTTLTPINVVSGTADYAAPTDLLRWNRLLYAGEELTPISAHEYGGMDASLMDVAGTPVYYVGDLVNSAGDPHIRLCPYPAETALGRLTGNYWRHPAALTTGGLNPTWHEAFHYVPCYWAAAILLRKDHRPEAADAMLVRFEQEKRRYRDTVAKSRPPRIDAPMTKGSGYPAMGRLPSGYPDMRTR